MNEKISDEQLNELQAFLDQLKEGRLSSLYYHYYNLCCLKNILQNSAILYGLPLLSGF